MLVKYEEWLAEFVKGKKEVASFPDSGIHTVHTVRRFLEGKNKVWEAAFTYTDTLVARSGLIELDGVTIKWSEWNTQHDVELSKSTK